MRKSKLFFAAIILLLLIFVGCKSQPQVKFLTSNGAVAINVELATTPSEYERGLMFRTQLDSNSGMLFVFDNEEQRTFWMKNTKIPLDIIFISADKKIVDLKENFQPCTTDICEKYTSNPAMFVVEVNSGFAKENNIIVGEKVIV